MKRWKKAWGLLIVAAILVTAAGALDQVVGGPSDDILDFIPAFTSGKINAPSNATAFGSPLALGITLMWQDNSNNETGFAVERKRAVDPGFTRVGTVPANAKTYPNTRTYLDPNIETAVTYTYRVKAYRLGKESGYSNEVSASCNMPKNPATPSNLLATPASASSIALTWRDNADNETNYFVERSTSCSSGFSQIAKLNANVTTYTDNGLPANSSFCYRIRAGVPKPGTLGYIYSSYSNTSSATTQSLPNPVLTGPSTVTQYFNLVWTYSWPQPWQADDHYVLEFSRTSPTSGFQVLATYDNGDRGSPKTQEILPEAADIGTTIYYRVRAYCNGGWYPSNALAISTPYISIGVYPTFDNLINDSSIDSSVRITVYANGDLQTGTFYVSLPMTGDSFVTSASLLRFDEYGGLPLSTFIAGRTIQAAQLILTPKNVPLPGTNYLLQLLKQSWNPATLTFATCPTMWATPVTTMLPPTAAGTPWKIDVKAHVQAWANGTDNYGFILRDAFVVHPGYTAARYFDIYSLETAVYYNQLPQMYLEIR